MYKIAWIYGNTLIYWHSIILSMALLTGVLFFLASYSRRTGRFSGAAVACPIAVILSLLLARLVHWYFRPDSYQSLAAAMTDLFSSGFAPMGAFAGCLLTAVLLRLLGLENNLPAMLDCMSIGGCAAIALGRLSCFFTPDDRGEILDGITSLPLAYPVTNPTSGDAEYRLAVFLLQATAAGILFCILGILFRRNLKKRRLRDGNLTLIFLLVHCASQVVLESTRYDALRLRSNGFISAVQVVSAATLVIVILLFSIQKIRLTGFGASLPVLWLLAAGCLVGGGYMEYYVQRHGDEALFGYTVMSLCMAGIVLVGFLLCRKANQRPTKRHGHFQTAPTGGE